MEGEGELPCQIWVQGKWPIHPMRVEPLQSGKTSKPWLGELNVPARPGFVKLLPERTGVQIFLTWYRIRPLSWGLVFVQQFKYF